MHLSSHWLNYGGHRESIDSVLWHDLCWAVEGVSVLNGQDSILMVTGDGRLTLGFSNSSCWMGYLKLSLKSHDSDSNSAYFWIQWSWVQVPSWNLNMENRIFSQPLIYRVLHLSCSNLVVELCHNSLALTLVWQLNLVSFVPDLNFHFLPWFLSKIWDIIWFWRG